MIPYYFMSAWPAAELPGAEASIWNKTETRHGVAIPSWTTMAGGMAGFQRRAQQEALPGHDPARMPQLIDMADIDQQDRSGYLALRGLPRTAEGQG